jgi:hypothetical protein
MDCNILVFDNNGFSYFFPRNGGEDMAMAIGRIRWTDFPLVEHHFGQS